MVKTLWWPLFIQNIFKFLIDVYQAPCNLAPVCLSEPFSYPLPPYYSVLDKCSLAFTQMPKLVLPQGLCTHCVLFLDLCLILSKCHLFKETLPTSLPPLQSSSSPVLFVYLYDWLFLFFFFTLYYLSSLEVYLHIHLFIFCLIHGTSMRAIIFVHIYILSAKIVKYYNRKLVFDTQYCEVEVTPYG